MKNSKFQNVQEFKIFEIMEYSRFYDPRDHSKLSNVRDLKYSILLHVQEFKMFETRHFDIFQLPNFRDFKVFEITKHFDILIYSMI